MAKKMIFFAKSVKNVRNSVILVSLIVIINIVYDVFLPS